jgi:Uma2 family endonuclease
MAAPTRTRYTYADLQADFPVDKVRREIVDGELFVSPSPQLRHQEVADELTTLLRLYAREHGGRANSAPLDVVLADDQVVQPDVLYFRPEHLYRMGQRIVESAPDLVVEVSSPSTRHLDLVRKRDLYARHGVPEYWYVDLEVDRIEVHRLAGGAYGTPELLSRADELTSPLLPGFVTSVDAVLGGAED